MYKFALFLLLINFINCASIDCKTDNNQAGSCVTKSLCKTYRLNRHVTDYYTSNEFINDQCGDTMVCCLKTQIKNSNVLLAPPGYCGVENLTIVSENSTKMVTVENPWQALLIQRNGGLLVCSGVVINVRFVLTRAYCVHLRKPLLVRIGDWDFTLSTDCDVVKPFFSNLTDFGVEDIIIHENYNQYTGANDFGLIRLNRDIQFTQLIRPICLPFASNNTFNTTHIHVNSYDLIYRIKQRRSATFLPNNLCKAEFDNHFSINKEINDSHICVNATDTFKETEVFGEYLTYPERTLIDNKKFNYFLSFLINRNHNYLPQYGEMIYGYLEWIKSNLYV